MGNSLERYLKIKVHQAILEKPYNEIVVIGSYNRYSEESIAFEGEKRDKPFNWERPTARIEGETLYIECFPGYDHVEHYAEIIACYLKIRQKKGDHLTPSSRVFFIPSSCSDVKKALEQTNLPLFPGKGIDTVVLGQVWHLPRLTGDRPNWDGEGPWQWIIKSFGEHKVAFLGFRPAFWGCISGEVVHYLATHFGVKSVIYLGKLGALTKGVEPNRWLATGGRSLVHGRMIEWNNVLDPSISHKAARQVVVADHATLGSVLHETRDWHEKLVGSIGFVDPEIGMMAQAAVRSGIQYGYLHIITDNLGQKYDEDLSNERIKSVLAGRKRLQEIVQDVIEDHFSRCEFKNGH
ncbi:hypothetical protein DM02DRAFT_526311 [Periconia macrospinosa]|uniref:Nucleoside phosphorylase domain-containing protein n=1 Tax=Periconia macrospinosa TaxID=97972 RepID=A0A2V1DRB7_9PLEO|nr:hypothetical protein DM02DRAFT_526311 [Periconia macrospinosa]